MPLVTDYVHVREVYQEARELGIALPVFDTEDRETLEAMLAATVEMGQRIGVDNLPIIPAWTVRYPDHPQMVYLTASGNPRLGNALVFSDLQVYMGDDSPYRKLRVLPHLDHAFPWLDGDILEEYADRFASVMCDASARPFDENIRITADYVERMRGRVVVEGAVEEIFEEGGQALKNEATTPEKAVRFLRETGVDILVPNVGTEHRSSGDKVHYFRDGARAIRRAVGNILCLHGSSSVITEDLHHLAEDGFIKVNIFTTLAVHGGQAVARNVFDNLGNMFTEAQLRELVQQGVLGEAVLQPGYGQTKPPMRPKLDYVGTPKRRDAWFHAVKRRCLDFLEIFHYERYAR